MASYQGIIEGIHARLETIRPQGLRAFQNGEPSSVQVAPFAFTQFGTLEGGQGPAGRIRDYTISLRVLVLWQDNVNAESELMTFLPGGDYSITALLSDVYAGDILADCWVRTYEAEGGYLSVAGTTYRIVDFNINVRDKSPE